LWRAGARGARRRRTAAGRRRPGRLAAHHAFLLGVVEARPDITMPELGAALFNDRRGSADPATLSRLLCRLGFSFKKTLMASECARADVAARRLEWRVWRQPLMRGRHAGWFFIDGRTMRPTERRPK
ncbi:MAG: hypothetical protein K2Q06_13105, partial [Parvularculaceae bacterium]|nr:hypothetical protein [Parvularculaceae bacterium]